MEFDQLIKRLDWLDEERRKDKTSIAALEERVQGLESELKTARKKIKELSTAQQKNSIGPERFDQWETALTNQRSEILKYIDDQEVKLLKVNKDGEKRIQEQFNTMYKAEPEIIQLRSSISDLKRQLGVMTEDDILRRKELSEWDLRIKDITRVAEQVQRSQVILEESRKIDVKRMADLQGDLTAVRKAVDESRSKTSMFTDDIRRLEVRLNELISSEADRRQAQLTFIESQNLSQVEREHAWKAWENKLLSLNNNNEILEHHLQESSLALRSVKKAQETYDDLVQKFERRINEISEMQRLAEDRFRQEWVTYKADEQKRWSAFLLSQEENRKDLQNELAKLRTRLTEVTDLAQTQQDLLEQTQEANEQLFHGMLSQINELLSSYGRITGKS